MTTPRVHAPARTAPAVPPYRLVLVGGGPRATYLLERLSATVDRLGEGRRLQVRVFERTGEFGAGQAHSPTQSRTSYLNRIGCQVSFAADDTVTGAGPLRPEAQRPTLHEWCRRRFEETGEADFDLAPEDWPKRYVHGLALRDMFDTFAADLTRHPGVELHLHRAEVVDVEPHEDGLCVVTGDGERHPADEVVLLTGHSYHDPRRAPAGRRLAGLADRGGARYVPHPYPMDVELGPDRTGPGTVAGCAGTGLTAIDAVLHLTEGRGGTFHDAPGHGLVYRPSGDEPAGIVAFSGSGLFTFARPDNHKPSSSAGDHPGTFLTDEAIRRLRAHAGRPNPGGADRLWRNESSGGAAFEPGGLDLTADFHPIRSDGGIDRRVTVLGVPSEGARSFLLSALRPNANHYVMRDTLIWLDRFWHTMDRADRGRRPRQGQRTTWPA
ncbi:FAD/NAD(P)-binding protein [Kitasatospora sp. NPDC101235]|uniref:FAD/NAD(P)-binding protein n=1 Tax=Kitasatospora sp. NPDC101235 TaxID=3364101 RepID=UPI00381583E6